MAGPGLEIFRFGLYVILRHRVYVLIRSYMLFPVGFMLYFGDPKWYEKYVLPVRANCCPPMLT